MELDQALVLLFSKTDQYGVFGDQEGALDDHAVTCQDLDDFLFAHFGETVLQFQFAVEFSACVEEGADRFPAFRDPFGQLRGGRPVFFDVTVGVGDFVFIKEPPCFTAGSSKGVTDKEIHGVLPWLKASCAFA